MGDARIDAYIEKSGEFARPILRHLRDLVHQACPDVGEDMKWGMPFYTLGGKNLANMAAFKEHVAFGYWEGIDVDTPKSGDAMGHYGRIGSLEDLPGDGELIAAIQAAAAKLAAGEGPKRKAKPVKVPPLPEDFSAAISANAMAQASYDAFPPSYQRDYIKWITEAKREATRVKRIAQAVEWMAEGKDRNWKYR